jgi:hypothetical protein
LWELPSDPVEASQSLPFSFQTFIHLAIDVILLDLYYIIISYLIFLGQTNNHSHPNMGIYTTLYQGKETIEFPSEVINSKSTVQKEDIGKF